jgi:serine phosphatase RsbU (regulator of sigma subunit)
LLFIQGEGRHAVRTETELSLAYGIQQTLVPTIEQRCAHFEIYGASLPSENVGGDLVDVVALRDGSIFAYVADIAGHGLSAGILMGMVKTAVRTQLIDLPSIQAVFERLNEVLPAVKESHMYATCTALRLSTNGSSTCVQCAIAGQPALLHASAATTTVAQISDEQLPLGLLREATYRTRQVPVEKGDILLVATDGILEAEDRNGVAFGMERLEQLLLANMNLLLPSLAHALQTALRHSYLQTDDQTVLLVRFLT